MGRLLSWLIIGWPGRQLTVAVIYYAPGSYQGLFPSRICCLSSGLRTALKTNHEKESGSRDGHSLSQLSHGPQNTMNDNNIRNNKPTNNSDKNSIYSMPVNCMLDTVLSIFYGLSYFIFTRTLWARIWQMKRLKQKELYKIPKVRGEKHWDVGTGSLTPKSTCPPHPTVQKQVTPGSRGKQEAWMAGQPEDGHLWRQPGTSQQ